MEHKWYVLYTRPKYERKIADNMEALNCQYYLPTITVARKWSDRVKKVCEPLFKNYIFVRTALSNKALFLQLAGVIRFVSIDGKPVPVDEQEIASIALLVDHQHTLEYESHTAYGDRIRVIGGVFSGVEGMVLKKLGKTRLLVRMPLLNQAISVEVDREDVLLL